MNTSLVGLELFRELEKPKVFPEEEIKSRIRFVLIQEYLNDTRNKIISRELNKKFN